MLREYRRLKSSPASYLGDARARDIVERNIQIAVQALIDLGDALVMARRWGRPTTAVQVIDVLVRNRVLTPRLGGDARRWVWLRNILVHEYARIDDAKVHRALGTRLSSLRSAIVTLARAHVGNRRGAAR